MQAAGFTEIVCRPTLFSYYPKLFRLLRRYHSEGDRRGRDFWHNLRDWLGGFPYEYATAGEVFNYLHDKFNLQLEYLNTHDRHGCNEFTFRRPR